MDKIAEQRSRVEASEPNRMFYEQGRLDHMLEVYTCPRNASSTEQLQWDAGWRDEHLSLPRPF